MHKLGTAACLLLFVVNQVGTAAILDKQLQGVKCPTVWNADPDEDDTTVRLYFYTSDGGSDQIKYRKGLKLKLIDYPLVLFVDSNCYMHSYQLVYKSGVTVVDLWVRPL